MRALAKTGLAITAASLAAIAGPSPGAVAAAPSTTYYAANTSGNLVQVTVAGAKITKTTVLKKGNPETRQLSPTDSDGDMVVGTVADIDGGTERMFTDNRATKKFYDLSALGTKIRASALYAGGAKVVYSEQLAHSFVIRTVAATGGTPTTVFTSKVWSAWDIAMTDNGKHLYMSAINANTQAGNVFEVTRRGLQRLAANVSLPTYYGTLALSPDDTRLAVARQHISGKPNAAVLLVTVKSSKVNTIKKGYQSVIGSLAWNAAGNALVLEGTKNWQRLSMKGATTAVGGTSTLSYPVLATA